MAAPQSTPPRGRPARSPVARAAAIAAIVAAVVLAAILMFGGSDTYEVTASFENSGQLVEGNQVMVGGRPIGKINSIGLSEDGRAEVKFSVGGDFSPLHRGTTATVRVNSLSGIANRYISLAPGPNDAGEIPDGGTIAVDDTRAPVEIDELFNTLDPRTRRGLQNVILGSAKWYEGRSKEAREALRYFNATLSSTSRLTRELVRDREAFRGFVNDTAQVVSAVAERREDLASGVRNAATTAGAIADENVALGRALGLLPDTLRRANTTFVNLRATLDDLDVLVAESKPATKDLAPLFRELRPLVRDARPTIKDLRLLIRRPGEGNDLIELTAKMPKLASIASDTFPRNIRALRRAQPVIEFIRPYSPDLTAWFDKFGHGATNYDANGHFARIQPIFNEFQYTNTPLGPVLEANQGGRLETGLRVSQSERCPGSAMQPPPDGSAPWRDSDGDVDCKPENVPPG